ncbi:MAG TPA: hypothetical protein VIC58_11320 [Actinomycetota bacterium]|jgi:hypothetical protein
MPTDRSYRVLAYEFRIASPRGPGAFLHRMLAPFEDEVASDAARYDFAREPSEAKPWVVYLDGECMRRGTTQDPVLEFATWHISNRAIASDHGFFAVHAAAAARGGAGVLLPGPPDAGKSTLVAALTRASFSYLTDEAALVDPVDGLLHPFPRSLGLDRASVEAVFGPGAQPKWRTGRQFHVRPSDLRPRAIGRPSPVRFVIAPRYEAGAVTVLEPMSRAEAVMVLARNAFHLDRFGGAGIDLLGRVVLQASCYRLCVGDLDDAVDAVSSVVEAGRRRRPRSAREGAI